MNIRLIAILLALASLVLILASFRLDKPVREAVLVAQDTAWRESAERKFYGAVRRYGDWPPLMLAAGIGLGIARLSKSRRWSRILVIAMIASSVAGLTVNSSRLTTGRTRPETKAEQGFYGLWKDGKLLVGNPAYNAFPSGHTATAFGFAFAILFASRWWGLLAMGGAVLVGWASIMLGRHHPSDVTASICVAAFVAWGVWLWMNRRGNLVVDRLLRFPPEPAS